jgi:hypothetical protein
MSELLDFNGLKMRGRVLQVGRSPRGSVTFVIRAHGPRLVGRGRFFGHIAQCHPSYANPQPGDLVEFVTKSPNQVHQLPKAVSIRKITT